MSYPGKRGEGWNADLQARRAHREGLPGAHTTAGQRLRRPFPEPDGLDLIAHRVAVRARADQEALIGRQRLAREVEALGGPGNAAPLDLDGPAPDTRP